MAKRSGMGFHFFLIIFLMSVVGGFIIANFLTSQAKAAESNQDFNMVKQYFTYEIKFGVCTAQLDMNTALLNTVRERVKEVSLRLNMEDYDKAWLAAVAETEDFVENFMKDDLVHQDIRCNTVMLDSIYYGIRDW